MIKIIDIYLLKLYLKRLVSVFAICMIIFIIQAFWLYIDELAGKGLDFYTIFKFLAYYSPKLVPLVLPLSVLLASLMTYGGLAENYEFAAMKSTGISLQRAMKSLIIFHIFLGVLIYFFSNNIIPFGELKSYNLRKNIGKLKPALAIREGIFNDLGQMTIKVEKKYGKSDQLLDNIIIHRKTNDKKNRIVIKSENGELKSETTDATLQLVLYNGYRYEELLTDNPEDQNKHPHTKAHFKKYIMNIDLSQFNNIDLSEENYTSTFRMQKINQLHESIDSLEIGLNKQKELFSKNFNNANGLNQILKINESESLQSIISNFNSLKFLKSDRQWRYSEVISSAIPRVKSNITNLESKKRSFFIFQKLINLHKTTLYDKYALVFSSFLLFIIGASLGALIRKGGLGLPLVLSVVIFLVYHYIGLFSKNAAEDGTIHPMLASWVSTIILAPFSVILMNRASSDKGFLNINTLFNPFKLIYLSSIKKKNNT